jgi:hypothetical protein
VAALATAAAVEAFLGAAVRARLLPPRLLIHGDKRVGRQRIRLVFRRGHVFGRRRIRLVIWRDSLVARRLSGELNLSD